MVIFSCTIKNNIVAVSEDIMKNYLTQELKEKKKKDFMINNFFLNSDIYLITKFL